ncbi:MAG TPA: DUF6416 domain-containing protein [Solirubrobacteraceae bacterium]|nr:DUF6416 domain-containing protein [Solirubrobacteraceae bacterium]
MADKQITVAVPEERVPEFYVWFASFLRDGPGEPPDAGGGRRRGPGPGPGPRGPGGAGVPAGPSNPRGPRGPRHAFAAEAAPWSAADADEAAWLYGKLAPPARALFDLLIDAAGERIAGNELASRLNLEKGAHGVAGILAWPGRYSRKLGRALPLATEGRDDGGTDYYMKPAVAKLFAAARERAGG